MRLSAILCLVLLAISCSVYSQGDYTEMDKHAASTPSDVETSVNKLADYLVGPAKSDLEKVRAIYSWIIQKISYDADALESGEYGKQSADQVLASKKGVCSEYSALFEALAKQENIEAVTVTGFSKGPGFGSDSVSSEPDHAWNAVKIDGEWKLIDCTWAAGYVDVDNKFVRKSFDHYFLTPPDQFIYDHFPQDTKWQLIDKPISRRDFENLVYLRPGFFRNKLKVISNEKSNITSDGTVDLTFGGPPDVQLNAEISRGQDRDASSQTFIQKNTDTLKVSSLIPRTGRYTLRLYAKRGEEGNRFEWAADYDVNVTTDTTQGKSMPQAFSTFYEKNAVLYTPMTGLLKKNTREKFRIAAPGAESVNVIAAGLWSELHKTDDIFEGEADVSGDTVQIAAKYPNNDSSYVLLKYNVR